MTESNKKDYVKLYVAYRWCRGIEQQFLALQKGFNELIPQPLMKPFDERELELIIGEDSSHQGMQGQKPSEGRAARGNSRHQSTYQEAVRPDGYRIRRTVRFMAAMANDPFSGILR